jgi:hypothetical protein
VLGETVLKRLQRVRPDRVPIWRDVVEAEQIHVEVADRGGQVAEPLELRGEPIGELRRERVAGQFQRRAGAAYRDPQVVQELGIQIAQNPVEIGFRVSSRCSRTAAIDRDAGAEAVSWTSTRPI